MSENIPPRENVAQKPKSLTSIMIGENIELPKKKYSFFSSDYEKENNFTLNQKKSILNYLYAKNGVKLNLISIKFCR